MKKIYFSILLLSIICINQVNAAEIANLPHRNSKSANVSRGKNALASCSQATAEIDLDINNVRAKIMNGGDMWWDRGLGLPRYEIPKINYGDPNHGPSVSSLFAASIWIGGVDAAGNLRLAAGTYRQNGNDYYPGPLNGSASITSDTCTLYDRFWKVLYSDIQSFKLTNGLTSQDIQNQYPSIAEWPAKGNQTAMGTSGNGLNGVPFDLAPYFDIDGNGIYNPDGGDFPAFNEKDQNVFPDQMIFWVYNDKGNIHTESSAEPIGLQVNATSFGFSTNDDVNNMTFYRYDLYNKGNYELDSTYIAQWCDPDLGCNADDYIGCDTTEGLGICYNADAFDESGCQGENGYGSHIPIVGIDFFEGPKNAKGKQLGMTDFYYYYNSAPTQLADPTIASQYYGYLTGTWKDGTRYTFGDNAHLGSQITHYVFSDAPNLSGTNPNTGKPYWSMCNPAVKPGDLRLVMSSGPFKLIPGARQRVTVGVVWVANQTYPCPSFANLLNADRKAQALFNSGFKLLNGPDAPDVKIKEYDKELVLVLENDRPVSNNYHEQYSEFDNSIMPYVAANPSHPTHADTVKSSFYFEGYQIFQLANATVSANDLHDVSKARLVAQVDIKNGISKIINYEHDASLNVDIPTLEVDGNDNGLKHVFDVKTDAFATGSNALVNHQTYYYMVLSYAFNNYKQYVAGDPTTQSSPYKPSRRNVSVYSGIPHIVTPENGGTVLHSSVGDEPLITRVEGFGNGSNNIKLTQTSIDQILANNHLDILTYDSMGGPINVRIFDPKKVQPHDYEVLLVDTLYVPAGVNTTDSVSAKGYWKIIDKTTNETKYSLTDMRKSYEQLFDDWGFSVVIGQTAYPGTKYSSKTSTALNSITQYSNNNGFLSWDVKFPSAVNFWYNYSSSSTADADGDVVNNWIRSGNYRAVDATTKTNSPWSDYDYWSNGNYVDAIDNNEDFENIAGKTWAPYALCATPEAIPSTSSASLPFAIIPGYSTVSVKSHKLSEVFSFDIVFTSDKSKWTRAAVVETDPSSTRVGATKNLLGSVHNSWLDKNLVKADGTPVYDNNSSGLSWFPGYAINLETGERLDIIFGEDSYAKNDNGNDMLWNPTPVSFNPSGGGLIYGGRHFIYVMSSRYDESSSAQNYASLLSPSSTNFDPVSAYSNATWVGVPMPLISMKSAKDGIIPAEFTLKIRIAKPYTKFSYGNNSQYPGYPKYTFSMKNYAAETQVTDTAKSALDLVNIVPNPYYAYSTYETGMLDTKVKITNLPSKCTITIYTVDGTFIRQYKRDTDSPDYQTWDLKNSVNVPISSGLYLIHISADGLGKNKNESAQRVVKWFGVMRPVDLNTF